MQALAKDAVAFAGQPVAVVVAGMSNLLLSSHRVTDYSQKLQTTNIRVNDIHFVCHQIQREQPDREGG